MHVLWMVIIASMPALVPKQQEQDKVLVELPSSSVAIDDAFWAPRIDLIRRKTMWHVFRQCEKTGRIGNFERAAGRKDGPFEGYFFNDSDVYKVLEGACYFLSLQSDSRLQTYVNELIDKITAAQQADGYLNSYFTLHPEEKRWSNCKDRHELYCAGHLIEAAIAHHQATGERTLLDVGLKLADHIDAVFGPDQHRDIPGHPEIELALLKLYRHTGRQRYRDLALFFLEERGRSSSRPLYGEYCQDHRPVSEQTEAVGHAVRAMYLYSAMTDAAALTAGTSYTAALTELWKDVTQRKMYITGGVGSSASNEGFTKPYDLPNDSSYAETCAAIGLAMWAHRLNLLHRDAQYADVMELAIYNGINAAVSADGEKFFYANPLSSSGHTERRSWYSCACCPPNLVRFFGSLGNYVYACSRDSIYVNLYLGSQASVELENTIVGLAQRTSYPWNGSITFEVDPTPATAFSLYLRIPQWSENARIKVNDQVIQPVVQRGYAKIKRRWQSGDVVVLELPMPVRRIHADPRVQADRGRVALQRGPVVYCLEAVDHSQPVSQLILDRQAPIVAEHRSQLLGGVTVLRGKALVAAPAAPGASGSPMSNPIEVDLTAVPYYAWDNRGAGEMVVWISEKAAGQQTGPE